MHIHRSDGPAVEPAAWRANSTRSAPARPWEDPAMEGIVAAGHPVSAEAGAAVLRDGGNAVDAAIGACPASWAGEPLLTGPGAGGYMLVAGAGVPAPVLLDFFVSAPSDGD